MADFLIVGGILLLGSGIAGLFRAGRWHRIGREAVCRILEIIVCDEQRAGGLFSRRKNYVFTYKTELTCNGVTESGTWKGVFETREEGARLVGKELPGMRNEKGVFLRQDEFDGLRKKAVDLLIGGGVCLAVAALLLVLVSRL